MTKARAASNPELSPHLSFVDMGGHGYAVVCASGSTFETGFVCIPRPLERSDGPDGGGLRYRAHFQTQIWRAGDSPKLTARILEGDPRFSFG
jgi:alkaline phosphatase D